MLDMTCQNVRRTWVLCLAIVEEKRRELVLGAYLIWRFVGPGTCVVAIDSHDLVCNIAVLCSCPTMVRVLFLFSVQETRREKLVGE